MRKGFVGLILGVMVLGSFMACGSQTNTAAKVEAPKSGNSHADQLYIEVSALGNLDYFYDHKKLSISVAPESIIIDKLFKSF